MEHVDETLAARREQPARRGIEKQIVDVAGVKIGGGNLATITFNFQFGYFDMAAVSASLCGRSFSSKDESSSTGAADTSRSFDTALSLAAATLGR